MIGIGGSCTYSFLPTSQSFNSDGGTDSVSVTAPTSCDWTAISNDSWITITLGNSGSGNGTVNYSVLPNTSTSSRNGTMTIAGKAFTVTQTGVGANATPNIKANGSDGPVTPTDNLSVTVSLDPGSSSGISADWWVAADVSGTSTIDGWYYLDVGTMNWTYAGVSYTDLSPTYQGPLFDLGTFAVLNMDSLPVGKYTFYFAVDTNRNGILDFGELFFDSVVVNITP